MKKKTLKIIYKLRQEKFSQRKIKSILQEKYNINEKHEEINKIVRKIPYVRGYEEIELKKILYLYANVIDVNKVVQYLNKKYGYTLTKIGIRCLANDHGVKKKNTNMYSQSFITRKEEREMVELYKEGYTGKEIAKMFGYKTKKSVYDKLEKFNLERRDWNSIQTENKKYSKFSMKTIDNKFKGYFLGFILTDGYVNIERGYVGIDLCDIDAIKYISENTGADYKAIKYKGKEHYQTKYRIILYGRELIKDMERLGVVERKTFIAKGPVLYKEEEQYIPYIIRGMLDGDGWIRKDGKEFFISSASKELIYWCLESLNKLGFENLNVRFIKNDWNGIYLIRTGRAENLECLKNKI